MHSDTDALHSYSLRPYQEEAVEFLTQVKRAALWDEMGLGKTASAITALSRLHVDRGLIVAPKVALGVWEEEFEKWWPEAATVLYTGHPPQRSKAWEAFERIPEDTPKFLVTNYHQLAEVLKRGGRWWKASIFDEAHTLRNRTSGLFNTAQQVDGLYQFQLTGTPIGRGVEDLWAYLNLMNSRKFSSYWSFVRAYCVTAKNPFGGFDILGPKNPAEIRALVSQYTLRRLKSSVLQDLPAKQRQAIYVDMPSTLQGAYEQLAEEMLLELNERVVGVQNPAALTVRLRQLLVHPELLDLDLPHPGLDAVLELTEQALDNKRGVVIFCPFAQALHRIENDLRGHLMGLKLWTGLVQGSNSAVENADRLRAFRDCSYSKVLLATTSLGVGWSATEASVGIFLGYEWNPILNWQCEDRLHRMGQQDFVNIYYIVHKGTIDDHVMDVLNEKTTWAKRLTSPQEFVRGESR